MSYLYLLLQDLPSSVSINQSVSVTQAEVVIVNRRVGTSLQVLNQVSPFSADFSSAFGSGQSQPAIASLTISASLSRSRNLVVSQAQSVARVAALALNRLFVVASPEPASVSRLIGMIRSTVQTQTLQRVLALGHIIPGIVAGQVATAFRTIMLLRVATQAEAAMRIIIVGVAKTVQQAEVLAVIRQSAIVRRLTQNQNLARSTAISVIRVTLNAQTAGLLRAAAVIRSASNAVVASAVTIRAKLLIVSATQSSSAALLRMIAILRSIAQSHIASRASAFATSRLPSTVSGESAVLFRTTRFSRGSLITGLATLIGRRAQLIGVATTSTQATALLRQVSHSLTAITNQTAALFRGIGHAFAGTTAQVVAIRRMVAITRAALMSGIVGVMRSVGWMRSATTSQAASRILAIGLIRSATATQIAALVAIASHGRAFAIAQGSAATSLALIARVKMLAAINAQVAVCVTFYLHAGINMGKAMSAVSVEVVAAVKATGRLFNASGAQAVARVVQAGLRRNAATTQATARSIAGFYLRSLTAASGQALSLQRLIGMLRATSMAQTVNRTAGISVLRSALNPQAPALQRLAGIIRTVAGTQVAAVVRGIAVLHGSVLGQSVARAANFGRSIVLAALDAQVDFLVRLYIPAGLNFGRSVGTILPQTVTFNKTMARLLSGIALAQNQAAFLIRRPSRQISSVITSVLALLKTANSLRVSGSPLVVLRVTTVSKGLFAVSPETVVGVLMRAISRSAATNTAEVVALFRFFGKAFAIIATSVSGLVRGATIFRRSLILQVAGRSVAVSRILSMVQGTLVTMASTIPRGMAFVVRQVQTVSRAAQRIAGLGVPVIMRVVSGNTAAIGHGLSRTFGVISQQASLFSGWYHRFIPLALRRRVVRLPPPIAIATLPRAVRRVVLPPPCQAVMLPRSIRRIVVPKETEEMSDYMIHDPEPAVFTPFDPSDQETFTFDWSTRGYAGDAIIFASIVSVPAGVNFIGPTFIEGTAVSITVGPFAALPPAPTAYSLRCMVVFHSGRISNYSVAMPVMAL